ncbi:hypothetical protein Tco_0822055 [Tanacetum coccineum]|uniref:Retrovirus-related Pol polyprotein from transposon TNT 1-94-like beta-barrel domain-containing protein n=1 Tax=Tanacetum coccineum TaxID=301880 RepID=A0ABQ5AI77_9ASTR
MDDPNITMEEYIQLMADKALGHFETDFPAIVYNDASTSNQNVSSEPTVSIYNAIKSDIDFHISFSDSEDEDYTFIYNKESSSYKLTPINDLKPEPVNDYVEINIESCSENIDVKPMDSVICISKDTTPVEFDENFETNHDIHRINTAYPGPEKEKQRPTLLMALPEDHLAKFHKMTYAKEMWDAIKSRFGGNDESKKMQKYILKQRFKGFSVSNLEGLHKFYDRFQSLLSQLEIHRAGEANWKEGGLKSIVTHLRRSVDCIPVTPDENEEYALMLATAQSQHRGTSTDQHGVQDSYKEKEDLKAKVEKWHNSSKNLGKLINTQMSANDKFGLGYGDHRYDGILSYESEVLQSVFKVSEPVVNESNVECQPKVWSDAPIIEEYESDSEDEYVSIPTKEQETPSFANQQVKTPRETVKNHFTHSKNPKVDKKKLGYGFTARACFVCGSLNHLIRDCDFPKKRMAKQAGLNNKLNWNSSQREIRPIRNNVQRMNNQNQFVPTAVLTRTSKIPVNTARASGTKNDYPHRALQNIDKGIVDSGCSRHMTGNKAYLAEYQDFNGGPVAFGGSKGYITGKGPQEANQNADNKSIGAVQPLQNILLSRQMRRPIDQEDQASLLDELERLKRQEKDANDAAEALRKEFAQQTEDLLLQAGAAKPCSTNIVNTASTPHLCYFTNLETVVNVSPIPTSRINSFHPSTLILGDPKSAVQTRSKVTKSSRAHAFVVVTPKTSHLSDVKRIFRYLKDKPKLGLWYPRVSSFDLEAYSDSDYAGANLDRNPPTGALISLSPTITHSKIMVVLESCPKHNMVAYLEKTDGNAEFHEIIDFLTRSSIHHALTGKHFSGKVTPLFASMLVQPTEDEGAPLERPSETQPTPSPPHPSEATVDPQSDPSPRPSPSTTIPDSIPESSGGNHGGHSSSDKSLSGNEGDMTLQSVYDLCISVCTQVSDQAKEIQHLKAQIKKLKKQAKPVITHHRAWMKSVSLRQRLAGNRSLMKNWMQKEYVSKQGRKPAKGEPSVHKDPLFDEIPEDTLDYMETEDAQDVGRTKGVVSEEKENAEDILSTKDVLSTAQQKVSYLLDKLKKVFDDQTEEESYSILTQTPTFNNILDNDETIAQVLLNMSQAKAVSREKEKGIESKRTKGKRRNLKRKKESESESDGIPEVEKKFKRLASDEEMARKVRIEADRLLAEKLQEEEREQFTIEERAKFLHDTIVAQRKFLARQRSKAIRNRPPTKNQLRNQMMTYLKHSTEDERKIKEMNEGASDPDKKKKIVKEDVSAKVPAKQDVAEQGTKKIKGGHMKMIPKKRKIPQPDVDNDDEHRKCLKIVTFDGTIDSEIMETKSFISKLDKVSSPEGDYLVVYRVNGNFRAFNYLMEVLHIFDRQDLFHLYDLVMKQYSESTPEGIELILWGDLKIMMESSIEVTDQGDFWNDQQDWEIVTWRLYEACGVCILEFKDGTVIHMLVERKYPLSKELLQRMLDFGLEVEVESTAALDLIRVLNSPCFMVKSWLVQDQTVLGKDYSNLLIADSLLKTIWFINAPCYGNEALASPKANGGSTVNGKAAYELKGRFLDDLCENTFSGTNGEDAVKHIEYFLKIVDPIDLPNVDNQEVVTNEGFSDLEKANNDDEHKIAKIFMIETNLFDYETPLCIKFNEFNYLLKVDTELFTHDIERTKTYEDYKNKWNNEVEEPWSDNGVPFETCVHIFEPFHFKNRKAKWPTCNSNEDGFCNGKELPGMVRVGYMTYFQDYEWYDNLTDSSLKEEAPKQKAIYEMSWGDATQSVINFCGWLKISFKNFHELNYELLVKLEECWWKINDHECSPFTNWRDHIRGNHYAIVNTPMTLICLVGMVVACATSVILGKGGNNSKRRCDLFDVSYSRTASLHD